jgi:hypothetical protein
MKKGLMLGVLAMASLAMATDVVFDGQVRYRLESTNGTFDGDVDPYNFAYLRTRLGAKVTPQDGLNIYIQAQDSRTIGGLGNSATTVGDVNMGLHQAYFTWDCQAIKNLTILAGRFEYAKADERFFGKSDWNNNGMADEGWALVYKASFATIDLFGVKADENFTAKQDVTDFGLYFNNILDKRLDVFYNVLDMGQNALEKKNSISTIGVHYDNTYFDKLGVNFNFGKQMGTDEQSVGEPAYAGMMFGLDLNYGLDLPVLNKVGFGYESMSGQDTSGDITQWIELFPSAHKFHGYQDIVGQMGPGLNDLQLNFMGALPGGMNWKLDYHMFTSAEEYSNNTEAAATDVGSEIDLSLGRKMDNFGVNLGWSSFTPADNFDAAGNTDAQSLMYLQFTAGF